MQFDKTSQKFGKDYISIQKLYTGELYEEYKVKNSPSNIFVLKLFNKKRLPPKKIIKEIQIGIHLNKKEEEFSHVIKYISSGSELSSKRTYIVYELLEKKSLLDYLVLAPYFEERFGKIVFWKLITIIQLLHKIGIGGMSISLDKIWIDDNYYLKLSGIDSAQFIKDPKSFKSSLLENDFSQLSDLVLQLISGKSLLTIPQVQLLKYIEKEKYELMWKSMEMQSDQKFSEEIKELINFLLSLKFNKQKKGKLQEFLNGQSWCQEINSKENEDYFKETLKRLEENEKTPCNYHFH
jgi:hypothetical protein